MDRVRRLSELILERHPDLFTTDFEKNKQLLSQVAIIRTKELRNEIAGYVTAAIRDRMGEKSEGQTVEEIVASAEG